MSGNDTTPRLGQRGEDLAADYLSRQHLTLIARNHRCRGGEIDLICREGRTLVFVEVRQRSSGAFGGAAASITATKRRRLILAAQHYLATVGTPDADCRFDCVLIEGAQIEWIKNAFLAD